MSITTPVSAATPARAMNPTATATLRLKPMRYMSHSPPVRAKGTESMTMSVSEPFALTGGLWLMYLMGKGYREHDDERLGEPLKVEVEQNENEKERERHHRLEPCFC